MMRHSTCALPAMHAGDHFCGLFESDAEHREQITGFVRGGLEGNERVIYVHDHSDRNQILGYLEDTGVDVRSRLDSGQLRFCTPEEAYLRGGVFEPEAMLDLLHEMVRQTRRDGYDRCRASAEMTWALRGAKGSERLVEYEAKVSSEFASEPFIALCQYDWRRFAAADLLRILRVHPRLYVGL